MMTKKDKNDKVAAELRGLAVALGVGSVNTMLTDMRRAYLAGERVTVIIGDRAWAAEQNPPPVIRAQVFAPETPPLVVDGQEPGENGALTCKHGHTIYSVCDVVGCVRHIPF